MLNGLNRGYDRFMHEKKKHLFSIKTIIIKKVLCVLRDDRFEKKKDWNYNQALLGDSLPKCK